MSEWFHSPEYAWLLSLPLGVFVCGLFAAQRRRRLLDQLISSDLVDAVVVGRSGVRRLWKSLLLCAALFLLALAIMRPQWGEREVEINRRGIDIVFAVDVSKSMLAEDVKPNRIERVKLDIRYFVREVVENDRIGLVAFAGAAQALCPLTLDRGAFEIFLDGLDIGTVSRGGTDMSFALAASLESFGDEDRNHKAIILFTDGEGHDPLPETELEEAQRRGVRIYTIGIGSADGERIPLRDEDGNRTWLKDHEGNIVMTRLDDKRLKTIAQRSLDGAYAHLSGGRANLERIYADNIRKIQERELKSQRRQQRIDRFPIFLLGALLLLVLQFLIPVGGPIRLLSPTEDRS